MPIYSFQEKNPHGGAGGALEVLLTLFQPEGVDYVHHITASTPRFENLTTSLQSVSKSIFFCLKMIVKSGLKFF